MQMPGNLWRQVWRVNSPHLSVPSTAWHLTPCAHDLQEAQPVAIREQKLLFDHVREGEKVLHLLETITPAAFMEQYASAALFSP
jgi:hypothetical protein